MSRRTAFDIVASLAFKSTAFVSFNAHRWREGALAQGHTDNTGVPDLNQKLSEDRAATVKTWLVAHGVGEARLNPRGFGATRPVADNKTPEGRARNRRVELAKK